MTDTTAGAIIEAAENAGLEVRTNYSGRCMYGKQCLAIVGTLSELLPAIYDAGCIAGNAGDDEIPDIEIDSMGNGSVVYFPQLQVDR